MIARKPRHHEGESIEERIPILAADDDVSTSSQSSGGHAAGKRRDRQLQAIVGSALNHCQSQLTAAAPCIRQPLTCINSECRLVIYLFDLYMRLCHCNDMQ